MFTDLFKSLIFDVLLEDQIMAITHPMSYCLTKIYIERERMNFFVMPPSYIWFFFFG